MGEAGHATGAGDAAAAGAEPPSVIVDMWSVADGMQDRFLERLVALLNRLREADGFLDAQILEGVDPTHFTTVVRMRSVRARENVMADPATEASLRELHVLGRAHFGAYSVLRRFGPAGGADGAAG